MMQVLMAIGDSAHSHTVVQQCLQLAQTFSVEVTVLTVIKDEADAMAATAVLLKAESSLKTAVFDLKTKIRVGQVADEIAAEANRGNYDLLLLGERLNETLMSRLLGSTVLHILAQTNCPVLIAKEQANPLQRILICDSGAQEPGLPDRLTVNLSELLANADEVTVLHVMSQISAAPGIPGQQLRADAAELIDLQSPEGEWLAQDMQRLQQVDVQARPKIRHGLVVDEILAELEDGRYDLIIIGEHQPVGWQRFLLEDVARHIITKADRPVLVCPSHMSSVNTNSSLSH